MAIKPLVAKIKNWLLDLLFPRHCLNCGREGSSFCLSCQDEMSVVWPDESRSEQDLLEVISMGMYRDKAWQNLIQNFKYSYDEDLAEAFEKATKNFTQKYPEILSRGYDLIVPIPLARRRHLERSFNQSEIIAEIISRYTAWPVNKTGLIRARNTPPQATLSDDERKINIKDAFKAIEPQTFKNQKILLVDDVFTTGSTIKEAADELMRAGSAGVGAWVLARRSPRQGLEM